MPEQKSNTLDEVMVEIYRAIYTALESRLHMIGSVIDAESRKEILAQQIYDKGDFYGNTGYVVETDDSGMTLRVGSNERHEPFVLGGKVPSWTPIAPLKSWVERKGLSWTDKKSGKLLTVDQIAHMIQAKIKREGIAARNVFAQVIANREHTSVCGSVKKTAFSLNKSEETVMVFEEMVIRTTSPENSFYEPIFPI